LDIENRTVIHRAGEGGGIATRVAREGAVLLDPPGIALEVAESFLGAEG
jgi:hypothetical protein